LPSNTGVLPLKEGSKGLSGNKGRCPSGQVALRRTCPRLSKIIRKGRVTFSRIVGNQASPMGGFRDGLDCICQCNSCHTRAAIDPEHEAHRVRKWRTVRGHAFPDADAASLCKRSRLAFLDHEGTLAKRQMNGNFGRKSIDTTTCAFRERACRTGILSFCNQHRMHLDPELEALRGPLQLIGLQSPPRSSRCHTQRDAPAPVHTWQRQGWWSLSQFLCHPKDGTSCRRSHDASNDHASVAAVAPSSRWSAVT